MNNKIYISLILLHVGLGVLLFYFEPLSYVFSHLSIFIGILWVFRNRNANEEALMAIAYIVGSELLVKMTKGYFIWEYAKYALIIITFLAIYYSGFSKKALPIWLYGILFIPGLIIGFIVLGDEPRFRQTIIFNILGPITLMIISLYTFMREISQKKIMEIMLFLSLPIISCVTFSILYTPDFKIALVHTGSNFETSGGYGPNQVATFFGLAMFVFFVRAILESKNKLMIIINLAISFIFLYRALLTFSRGGLITGILMILFFLFFAFFKGGGKVRLKISMLLSVLLSGIFIIWIYTTIITGGLIEKRYKNQDALGREKGSAFSGREEIAISEINLFLEKPFFGGGVGGGFKYRVDNYNISIASHNEITRMLGEHGLLGIIALLILIFTPLILYLDNKQHLFLLSFLLFWFLTLNHTSMRVALPAFIYALSLLKVQFNEKTPLPRKQTLQKRHQSLYHRNA